MRPLSYALSALCLIWLAAAGFGQAPEPVAALGDKEPVLRLDAGGPTNQVTALAFSPDGETLYVGCADKVVRTWKLNAGRFIPDKNYRVPIGPGTTGIINTLAVSPHGEWLAIAGKGVIRQTAGFREKAIVVDPLIALTPSHREDEGIICVINTQTNATYFLRGHQGAVLNLAFAPATDDKSPVLVSCAREWDGDKKAYVGGFRVWDVANKLPNKRQMARLKESLPDPGNRVPSVVVVGSKDDLRIVFNWKDENLRVWDGKKEKCASVKDDALDYCLAYSPELKCVLSGMNGGIQAWNVFGAKPAIDSSKKIPVAGYVPWALHALSLTGDGRLDGAAALCTNPSGKVPLELLVYDLRKPDGLAKPVGQATLWDPHFQQLLAAAPTGRYLAAAGNKDHEVLVFAIADLLRKNPEPRQRIRGAGTTIRHVAFVSKGKDQGLVLNDDPLRRKGGQPLPKPDMKAGDFIFNVSQRSLSGDVKDWNLNKPDLTGWKIQGYEETAKNGKVWQVLEVVKEGQKQGSGVRIPKTQAILDLALLPAGPFAVPILALALLETGEPTLALYNAVSGEQIRQFVGHEGAVRFLAFRADGNFLVSAGDDQLVCVWSLMDLDKTLGVRGLIKGIAYQPQENKEKKGLKKLVLTNVDLETLLPKNQGKLKEGEILEAIVEGGKDKLVSTILGFYEAVAPYRPGKTVTVRVRDAQGKARTEELVVSQAIDDRKPLLSLFLTRAARAQDREWIGWNPIGPYDSSGARAEQYLGWHIHTGKAEAPTQFAQADQYRKDYYQKNVLSDLLDCGEPPPAKKGVEEPEIGVAVESGGAVSEQDARGVALAAQKQAKLRVQIDRPALESVASVKWQIGNQPEQEFDLKKATGKELTADLTLERGKTLPVRVVLRTLEAEPKVATRELSVRFQPAAPVLIKEPDELRLNVRQAKFTVKATVKPAGPKQAVKASVQGKDAKLAKNDDGTLDLLHEVELKPGLNQIVVLAVNADAEEATKEEETSRLFLEVFFTPDKVPPPAINLKSVIAGGNPLPVEGGRPVVVNVPVFTVEGDIGDKGSKELLTSVKLSGPDGDVVPKGFVAKEAADFKIQQSFKLKQPGVQQIRVFAQSTNSKLGEGTLTVDYQPLLPELVLKTPAADLVLYQGEHKDQIDLLADLVPADDPWPYAVEVKVNEKSVLLQPKDKVLKHSVKLEPGDKGNRIEIVLSNKWGQKSSTVRHVRYLRPPQIVQLVQPKDGAEIKQAKTTVKIEVESPIGLNLKPELVKLTMNGGTLPAKALKLNLIKQDPQRNVALWSIEAADVDLVPGKEKIVLCVGNDEAECRVPGNWTFTVSTPVKPAVVEFIDPQRDVTVTEAQMTVRFRVKSESELKRLEVVAVSHGQGQEVEQRYDRKKLQAAGPDEYSVAIALSRGGNRVRVEAVNDAGLTAPEVRINYLRKPVQVVLTKPVPRLKAGQLVLPPAAEAKLTLEGEVVWPDDQPIPQGAKTVRIFVNDFLQPPAPLTAIPGQQHRLAFTAPISLTRKEGNQIAIELPDLPQDSTDRRLEYTIDCAKPAPIKVNLLLIGVGEQKDVNEVNQLFEQACKLLLRLPFANYVQSRSRYVLLGEKAKKDNITQRLHEIRGNLENRAAEGAANEVWVIYYAGREVINDKSHYLLTSSSLFNPNLEHSALRCDQLSERLNHFLGARILLLDVERQTTKEASTAADGVLNWPAGSRVGVLRSSWLGKDVPLDARLFGAKEEPPKDGLIIGSWTKQVKDKINKKADLQENIPTQLEKLALGKQ